MNTIRLFLFPTEWSATLVLFFFALRRMANCQNLWEVLILLGFFLSIFFMVCLASLSLCAHGHAREGLGQTDRRARHASSHVRRACIASKTRKNEKNRMGCDLNENVRTTACETRTFANEFWQHQQRKKGATDCHKG